MLTGPQYQNSAHEWLQHLARDVFRDREKEMESFEDEETGVFYRRVEEGEERLHHGPKHGLSIVGRDLKG